MRLALPCVAALLVVLHGPVALSQRVSLNEIGPVVDGDSAHAFVEIRNGSTETENLDDVVLALDGVAMYHFPAGASIAPGSLIVLHLGIDGTDGAGNYYAGVGTSRELRFAGTASLHESEPLTIANTMVDFVQWGAAESALEVVAAAKGIWRQGDFVDTSALGAAGSIAVVNDAFGSARWAINDAPSPGLQNAMTPSVPVVVNEVVVSDASQVVELTAAIVDADVDVSGFTLCIGGEPSCYTIPAGQSIPAGGYLLIQLGQDGVDGPGEVFTGPFPRIDADAAELALFRSPATSDSEDLVDYVRWGHGDPELEPLAVEAGIWPAGATIDDVVSGGSLAYIGAGDIPSSYRIDETPSPGRPNDSESVVFRRADCNDDGDIAISDPLYAIQYLFLGGEEPACYIACDSNGDSVFDIADATYTLAFLFRAGTAPPEPLPSIAFDDSERFIAATGARAAELSPTSGPESGPVTAGELTVRSPSGSISVVDWTPRLPGNELTVCGRDSVDIDLAEPVYSFGFSVFEPADEAERSLVLFEDDFESGLDQWTGGDWDPIDPAHVPGEHDGVIASDPLENDHALSFVDIVRGIDILTREGVTSPTGHYRLSFDYLGLVGLDSVPDDVGGFVGHTNGLPGDQRIWTAGTPAYFHDIPVHLPDTWAWEPIAYEFAFEEPVHLMFEDFFGSGGVAGDAYFDNVRLEAVGDCFDVQDELEDSTFRVTLLNDGVVVQTHLFDPGVDVGFFGVWTTVPFDRVEIREISGGAETDFFGRFFTGDTPRGGGCGQELDSDRLSCSSFTSCS